MQREPHTWQSAHLHTPYSSHQRLLTDCIHQNKLYTLNASIFICQLNLNKAKKTNQQQQQKSSETLTPPPLVTRMQWRSAKTGKQKWVHIEVWKQERDRTHSEKHQLKARDELKSQLCASTQQFREWRCFNHQGSPRCLLSQSKLSAHCHQCKSAATENSCSSLSFSISS